jgi:hypothetical protein
VPEAAAAAPAKTSTTTSRFDGYCSAPLLSTFAAQRGGWEILPPITGRLRRSVTPPYKPR